MAIALLINGVDSETLGYTLAEAPGWLDAPKRQTPSAAVSGTAGEKALGSPIEASRVVTLTGTVRAATAALARGKVDSLKLALLASPLALTFADNSTRRVYGVLEGFTVGSLAGAFVQEGLKVDATVRALDPYSYDISLTTVAGFGSGNRLPLGTGPIRPIVTISGASTNPVLTLRNSAGAAMGSLTLTITTIVGDTLVIDMGLKTVKKNGVSSLSAITAGDFFTIDPTDQTNYGGSGPYIDVSSGAGSIAYSKSWR